MTAKVASLADVCEIAMGQAPKGDTYNDSGDGFPLIAGAGDFGELYPEPTKFTSAPTKVSQEGDIVLCIRATIGDRNWANGEYCLGRGVAGLRPANGTLDSIYLWHWLEHSSPVLKSKGRGATFLQVSKKDIASLQIPLPPLEEQKRIARILDEADALRVKRRESIEQLDALLQSIFLDMFGDPVTNPMGWETRPVGECGFVQGGLQVTSKRRSLPIEVPYLRVANVFRGSLDLDEVKTIRVTEGEMGRTVLKNGDILIVEGHGNPGEIGRCAVWNAEIAPCVHQNHLIRLRCDRELVHPVFVEAVINSEGGRRQLTGTARTTSGLNTISVSKVKQAVVCVPPMSVQSEFERACASVASLRYEAQEHLAELDTLFASLQSRAFNGQL